MPGRNGSEAPLIKSAVCWRTVTTDSEGLFMSVAQVEEVSPHKTAVGLKFCSLPAALVV